MLSKLQCYVVTSHHNSLGIIEMVLIELIHKSAPSEIDKHLAEHRQFLQDNYDRGLLLVSGPKIPRDGGICIALTSLDTAKELMQADPFWINDLATYRFVEFDAVQMHEAVRELCELNTY